MSFDTYSGPSPWESTNNKKNPFDTQETGTTQDTSSFDMQESGVVQDTSMFNTKGNKFGQVQDTSVFDTQKSIKKDKKFIYFNPEGLLSTRKHQAKVNKIIKKHLIKKFKLTKKRDEEILNLVVDIESDGKSKKDLVPKKTKKIEKDYELVDPQIGSLDDSQSLIKQEKKYKKQSHEDLVIDFKKDLKQKEQILQRDKEHNLHIRTLRQQGKTKKQILGILNQENKPRFIKYEKKYETFGKTRKVADTAIALVKKKDNLGAIHCTDWVNKIYQKVAGERVYDSHTLFNGVKHISKGTGIGAAKYAPRSVISSIKPGEHIMVDLPVNGKYNNGKTHSVIALSKPNDGLIEVASYPKYGSNPVIEMYDLYGLNRAKSAKPIRIQTV